MKTNRIPKLILDSKLDGKRRIRMPKTRWFTEAKNELRRTGVNNWREKAEVRMEWHADLRETKSKLTGTKRPVPLMI